MKLFANFFVSFLLLLLSLSFCSALQISEIMYDPIPSDDYNEWIELYSDSDFDARNLTLCGKKVLPGYINHSNTKQLQNESYILPAQSYIVITDGGSGTDAYFNFNISGIAFHTETSSMCGSGLKNSGTNSVFIEQNGVPLDNITYNATAKEGNTLSRKDFSFVESAATPGYANSIYEINITVQNTNQINLTSNQTNQSQPLNQTGNGMQLIQNLSTEQGPNNTSKENETTLNQTNSIQGNSDESKYCDWKIEIISDKLSYEEDEDFSFKIRAQKLNGSKTNISSKIMIFDEHDTKLREYIPFENYEATTSKTSSTYSPNVFGNLNVQVTLSTNCEESDLKNNVANSLFFIAGSNKSYEDQIVDELITDRILEESNFSIEEMDIGNSDEKNSILKVRLKLYRGNTSKYAVKIKLKEDDKNYLESTIYLRNKFTSYDIMIPFMIKLCSQNHTIILEGLNLTLEKSLFFDLSCNEANKTAEKNSQEKNIMQRNVSRIKNMITGNSINALNSNQENNSVEPTEIYSLKERQKKVALILLLASSILLNIVLIWKR